MQGLGTGAAIVLGRLVQRKMLSRRGCKPEVLILTMVGIGGLLFLMTDEGKHVMKAATRVSSSSPPTPPPSVPTTPWHGPECKESSSVANISGFADLPGHIQDFLRYKHCKEFPQLLDAPDKCGGPEGSPEVFLLLAIKSSPGNYERREIIRKTWGEERTYQGVRIRRLFLAGEARDAREAWKLNRLLRLEAAEHGDVLQWAFLDSFFNLTLKQVLFHSWLEAHCPGARFLLNGDDDVFTNTDNVVHYLLGMRGANDGDGHLYVGQLIANVGPIREKWSKYYVPEQVTATNSYPPYCAGGGVLMSGFTARTIYNESLGIELFPIDDVYLGMCLQKAGLAPASHMGIRTVGVRVPSSKLESFDPCYYKELLLVHRFVPYEMLVMWQAIHEPDLRCGKKLQVYESI
ncbi:N-acetyllactosaminide beta-1,3-N-acetylglucosaminyltransferase 3 isoform X3 [Mauremys reevesii]|uniref:N-acetyllactosaminide beta-1,3-N-acetylglucosaminyltransferase 3 isoform X3 n=1 Tax=Mauremys reevesii TaxID=260615 RepID=UPI00193EC97B|nr:N-acetyllactosaminide beta-1,3-N-acetylglucosaminyltransferase 3 isoform X3 [Mauremys reevesii]XP_039372108.1 N-acetyllactosaminide beta-1,3-N-acetylglucosaminyltransferase 3 isoform X3 [Mauremys reevesii]XP_039372110.1 N-acetyllactosaminide beta-1,3-N-acetylglucosaminyltransferase 3 isoform X3 [Mauremys reevesii]